MLVNVHHHLPYVDHLQPHSQAGSGSGENFCPWVSVTAGDRDGDNVAGVCIRSPLRVTPALLGSHTRDSGAATASTLPFPSIGDSALFEVLHPGQGNPRNEQRLGEN